MSKTSPGIKAGPFTFTHCAYDHDGDVLYLSVGKPREALTWESPEGHLVRLDPETGALLGVTVLHVAAGRPAEASWSQSPPARSQGSGGVHFKPSGPSTSRRAPSPPVCARAGARSLRQAPYCTSSAALTVSPLQSGM